MARRSQNAQLSPTGTRLPQADGAVAAVITVPMAEGADGPMTLAEGDGDADVGEGLRTRIRRLRGGDADLALLAPRGTSRCERDDGSRHLFLGALDSSNVTSGDGVGFGDNELDREGDGDPDDEGDCGGAGTANRKGAATVGAAALCLMPCSGLANLMVKRVVIVPNLVGSDDMWLDQGLFAMSEQPFGEPDDSTFSTFHKIEVRGHRNGHPKR